MRNTKRQKLTEKPVDLRLLVRLMHPVVRDLVPVPDVANPLELGDLGRAHVVIHADLDRRPANPGFVLVEESRAWMIVTPALLTGTGHSLIYHSMASLAMEPFPRELHGTGSVLVSITLDSGILIGAAVLGLIGEYLGFNWLFSSIGLACLICAIHFGLSRNR